MTRRPLRVLRWLLAAVLPAGVVRDGIVGDLEELFRDRAVSRGAWAAHAWYARQTLSIAARYLPARLCPGEGGGPTPGWSDAGLRVALRRLGRAPGYAGLVTLTLALGVGANLIVFSLVSGILLRPLSYPEADRIVSVSEDNPGIDIPPGFASLPNYLDWRDRNTVFEELALFRGRSTTVGTEDLPEYAYGALVTSEFFRTFGTEPLLGRSFGPEEVIADAPVAVISHGLWVQGFAEDPEIVGRAVLLDGNPHTVLGVMPPGFGAPGEWIGPDVEVRVWRPFPVADADTRVNRSYSVVGRLRPDVTLEDARAQMGSIQESLSEAYPEANGAWHVQVSSWTDLIVGAFGPALTLLLLAMALLFALVCANVANMSVNRVLGRDREIATREALGAGRSRVVGEVLTESAVLSVLGASAGVAVGYWGLEALKWLEPGRLPRLGDVAIDGPVLAFALVLAIVASLGFGGVTAYVASGSDPAARLRAGRASRGSPRWRLRSGLAVVQIATSFALLVGAGLLVRSFDRLTSTELGFDPEGVTAATVALSWDRVTTLETRAGFTRDVLDALASTPGVEAASMINSLPLSGSNSYTGIAVAGVTEEGDPHAVAFRGVSPGYFETMAIPVLAGRTLDGADLVDPTSVVVNSLMAERYWPDQDPVGREVTLSALAGPSIVVGVVGNVKHWGPDGDEQPELYVPYVVESNTSKSYVVRSSLDPADLADRIREVVRRVDPQQPVREIRSMDEWAAEATAGTRFQATAMSAAALLSTLLACVGLLAVLGALVRERRREIAIRMAIGARSAGVLLVVFGRAGIVVLLGITGGLVLSLGLGELMEGLLFEVASRDPVILGWAVAGVLFVASAAAYVPARRAATLDPARILRGD